METVAESEANPMMDITELPHKCQQNDKKDASEPALFQIKTGMSSMLAICLLLTISNGEKQRTCNLPSRVVLEMRRQQ